MGKGEGFQGSPSRSSPAQKTGPVIGIDPPSQLRISDHRGR